MTIVEALKESHKSGRSYSLRDGDFAGWIRWDSDHEYHGLTAEDLTSDSWEPDADYVHRLTGGRWELAE